MTLRSLRTLPLALAALVWAAGAVLLMANLLLPALGQGSMKLAPALAGVTAPEKAVLTWDGVLHGTYQATYARLVGTRMPRSTQRPCGCATRCNTACSVRPACRG